MGGNLGSDRGYENSGRQAGLIVEDVSEGGRVFGYFLIAPPTSKSTVPTPAKYYPFVGLITGSELLIKGQRTQSIVEIDAKGKLDFTEKWSNGIVGKIALRPFWRLVEAEKVVKR